MNVLAFGAHPDDIEYGCGGLLLNSVGKGHGVYLAVMTDGSSQGDGNRKEEQARSAKQLGARDVIWGGFADTELAAGRDLIVAVEDIIGRVKPDLVLVNYHDDAHQDHRALGSCVITACRYIKRVLFYHDYTSLNFHPDTFVNIENVLDKKRELLACHESQVKKSYPTGLDMLESVDALAAYYGFMAKVKYAEGFLPLRNLMDI